jgi:hypothetical protein
MTNTEAATHTAQPTVQTERIVAQHAKFLNVLSARVADRAAPEDTHASVAGMRRQYGLLF